MNDEKKLAVAHVQVRLTDEEKKALEDEADRQGLRLQTYLRRLIREATDPLRERGEAALDLSGLTPDQKELVARYANCLRSGLEPEFVGIINTLLDRVELTRVRQRRSNAG